MMILKKLFLFFLISLPALAFTQTRVDFNRTYSNTLPDNFKLDTDKVCNHIHDGIPDHLKVGAFKRSCYAFADMTSLQVTDLVASGKVYSDWAAFEEYINQILRKVMPKELLDDEGIHAYLHKDGRYNAFMTPSGMTFIHVGLFTDVYDEATIAGVLAHELAHYYMRHSLKQFIKAESGEFDSGIFRRNNSASKFSIGNELQSDSLAMVWMKASGYDLKGLVESFKIMERLQRNALLRRKGLWELKATTHPLSGERLSRMNAFLEKNKEVKGKPFLVSETKFKEFTKQVRPEILRHLLDNFDYDFCIETAFKFHIYDVENSTYVYYLMEAIRRRGYLDASFWNKNFITYRYHDEINPDDEKKRKKKKKTAHLFTEMPLEMLCLRPDKVDDINAKFYWEDLKFATNEEAFEFLFKIAQFYKEPECFLSYALSISHDNKIRNKKLRQYLDFEKVAYRDFATNLLNGTIRKNLKNEKLSVFSDFDMMIKQGSDVIPIRKVENEDKTNQTKILFEKALKGFEGRKPVFLTDMRDGQLNHYTLLREMERLSFIQTVSRGEKTELHILDPRYWEIMNQLKVNEIEFINCRYIETRKSEKTLEAYKEVRTTDFDSILKQVKRSRYFEVYITSLRMIEGGVMKVRYYGGEDSLRFKKEGNGQVVGRIKSKVKKRDQLAKDLDFKYKNQ